MQPALPLAAATSLACVCQWHRLNALAVEGCQALPRKRERDHPSALALKPLDCIEVIGVLHQPVIPGIKMSSQSRGFLGRPVQVAGNQTAQCLLIA